ncbi:MAG: hypothetical protein ACRCVU_01395 [Flavobacterium sp.]
MKLLRGYRPAYIRSAVKGAYVHQEVFLLTNTLIKVSMNPIILNESKYWTPYEAP